MHHSCYVQANETATHQKTTMPDEHITDIELTVRHVLIVHMRASNAAKTVEGSYESSELVVLERPAHWSTLQS